MSPLLLGRPSSRSGAWDRTGPRPLIGYRTTIAASGLFAVVPPKDTGNPSDGNVALIGWGGRLGLGRIDENKDAHYADGRR